MEVSSRRFTIMEEMIIQVALTVDINTDKRQRLFASRLLFCIVVELVYFIIRSKLLFLLLLLLLLLKIKQHILESQ